MGALIFKRMPTLAPDTQHFTIIDGQQRLTTILLLLKVLAEKTNASANFYQTFYTAQKEKTFTHNQMDNDVFSQLFYGRDRELNEFERQSKIFRCYQFFMENIDDQEAFSPETVMDLIYFVNIELEKDDDEQEIFETINSLGVDLTPGELLKNELFSCEEASYYYSTWGKTFEDSFRRNYWERSIAYGKRNTSNMLDLFLRSYYFLTADLPPGYEPIGSLFKNYQQLLRLQFSETGKHPFIEDLIETAEIFRRNFEPMILENPARSFTFTNRLVFLVFVLQNTSIIPYILFILKNAAGNEQEKIFSIVESYLVRRHICNLTASRYNIQFKQFIRDRILTADDLTEKLKHGVDNTSVFPSSQDVINALFSGERNITRNRLGIALLYLMELSEKYSLTQSAKLAAYKDYTFQELYPQKIENWSENNSITEREKSFYEYTVKLLGNFTFSKKKIPATKSWQDKKEILSSFSEGIIIAQNFLNKEKWTLLDIIQRTCELCNTAISTWKNPQDEPFVLPISSNIASFLENAKQTNDVYSIVQTINFCDDQEIKDEATDILLKILMTSNTPGHQNNDFLPHLLTEKLVGTKPYMWTMNNESYYCSHWSELFKKLTTILYETFPDKMQNFCSYGGDKYICSYRRREMAKDWDKIGEKCFIYTAVNTGEIQKSILNMLKALGIPITEVHVYWKL